MSRVLASAGSVERPGNGHAASRAALIQLVESEFVDGRHGSIVDEQAGNLLRWLTAGWC
jgi:hypothetical protein